MDEVIEANNEFTDFVIKQMLKFHDKKFSHEKKLNDDDDNKDEERYICIICNVQCTRRIKYRHEKSEIHLYNISQAKKCLVRALNSVVV